MDIPDRFFENSHTGLRVIRPVRNRCGEDYDQVMTDSEILSIARYLESGNCMAIVRQHYDFEIAILDDVDDLLLYAGQHGALFWGNTNVMASRNENNADKPDPREWRDYISRDIHLKWYSDEDAEYYNKDGDVVYEFDASSSLDGEGSGYSIGYAAEFYIYGASIQDLAALIEHLETPHRIPRKLKDTFGITDSKDPVRDLARQIHAKIEPERKINSLAKW